MQNKSGRWGRVLGSALTGAFLLAVPALALTFLDLKVFSQPLSAATPVKAEAGVPSASDAGVILLKNWENADSDHKTNKPKTEKPKTEKPKTEKPKTDKHTNVHPSTSHHDGGHDGGHDK